VSTEPAFTVAMRWMLSCGLSVGLGLLAGCATAPSHAPAHVDESPAATSPKESLLPDPALIGRVVSYNSSARYAILQFPPGLMAANYQRLSVYRSGKCVGELKVSGPSRDDRTAADLMEGDCQTGDEVRDR